MQGTAAPKFLRRIVPSINTPFLEDGTIDIEGIRRCAESMIRARVAGMLILADAGAGAGAAASLDATGKRGVAQMSLQHVDRHVPVSDGCSSANQRDRTARAVMASELGAQAIWCQAPDGLRGEALAAQMNAWASAGLPVPEDRGRTLRRRIHRRARRHWRRSAPQSRRGRRSDDEGATSGCTCLHAHRDGQSRYRDIPAVFLWRDFHQQARLAPVLASARPDFAARCGTRSHWCTGVSMDLRGVRDGAAAPLAPGQQCYAGVDSDGCGCLSRLEPVGGLDAGVGCAGLSHPDAAALCGAANAGPEYRVAAFRTLRASFYPRLASEEPGVDGRTARVPAW